MPRALKAFEGLSVIGYRDKVPLDFQNRTVIVATSKSRARQLFEAATGFPISASSIMNCWSESCSQFAQKALSFGHEGVWTTPKDPNATEIYEVDRESLLLSRRG